METLIIILLVAFISVLLFLMREQKREREASWSTMATRTSSFPPPAGQSTALKEMHSIIPVQGIVAVDGLIPETTANGRTPSVRRLPASNPKREQDNTQDNIAVTSLSKHQLDDYLKKNSISATLVPISTKYHNTSGNVPNNTLVYSEALRLASLDPEEVVYLNPTQWFHPSACESYPSKTTVGEELLMTIKGSWILKKPQEEKPSCYSYEIMSKKDAFIFLETNGYDEVASELAPHNPSNEL